MAATPFSQIGPTERPECLARALAKVLAVEPTLEAVTLSKTGDTLGMATLGSRLDHEALTGTVQRAVATGARSGARAGCGLLSGANDCTNCAHPLETEIRSRLEVRGDDQGITFARVTCPTSPTFWRWRQLRLPRFVQRELALPEEGASFDEWKGQLATALMCAVFGLLAALVEPGKAALPLWIAAYLAGGWQAAREAGERLRRGALDVHFLMLAVAAGSAAIGAWGEGAILLFLFSLSGALEHFALGRTQREIAALFRAAPKTATVIEADGREVERAVELLRPGMLLALKPGALFPVDGVVRRGTTAADEATLSGEAAPVEKSTGDPVFAGTLNLRGAVQVEVTRPAAESALQKIIHLIRRAQQSKAPSQRFTDRFGSGYTVIVLLLTVVMFFVWWRGYGLPPFATADGAHSAFYRAMTLLVVASPCALVLSIPSAILAAIAWAARRGILFRGGAAVEMLAEVDVVALDKTGTLTTGELTLEVIRTQPAGNSEAAARLACSLARHSTHPLSRALTRHARHLGWEPAAVEQLEAIPGQGISGCVDGVPVLLGRREFVAALAPPAGRSLLELLPPETAGGINRPEVWLVSDRLAACLGFRDEVRPEAPQLITALQAAGLHTVLLTGDRRANAAALHREVPLAEMRSELRPADKLDYILQQHQAGRRVAMVGDGVNDAPGLAAAHVGVAMGARGADAALEQADVVLMRDRLEHFLTAFQLSQRARRVIQQNLFLSLGTVLLLVGFALAGHIPLTIGVIGHEGSTVLVVLNSLRLLLPRRRVPP